MMRLGVGRRVAAVGAVTAAVVATALVALPGTAYAATSWFVAPAPAGNNANNCTSAATPCATITGVTAKAVADGDTITVAAGTYNEHPTIAKAVTINGAGAASTIINGGGTATTPFTTLTIATGAPAKTVTATGLTITGGFNQFGGGVDVFTGTLNLLDSVVTNNTASGTNAFRGGGGILVIGSAFGGSALNLTRVTVSNNKTVASGSTLTNGAGLLVAGPTTIADSTISGNTVAGNALGGGAYVTKLSANDTPTLSADHSSFTGNTAVFGGGIGTAFGTTLGLVNGSAVSGNTGADGAGLFVSGASTLADSAVNSNTSSFLGGGVFLGSFIGTDLPTMSATNTTFNGNSAATGGGGLITATGSTLTLTRATVDANTSFDGGGLYIAGGTIGLNTTNVTNNTANSATTANGGNGGGIFQTNGALTVNGGQLAGNKALPTSPVTTVSGWGGNLYEGPAANNDAPVATINDAAIGTGTAQLGGAFAVAGNVFAKTGTVSGQLTLNRDTLSGNTAQTVGGGFAAGVTTITDSTFANNTATAANGVGGGLFVGRSTLTDTPNATLDHTTLTTNNGGVFGGGVGVNSGSSLTLRNNSVVSQNTATDGGGIFNAGTTAISGSTISGNHAGFSGGGIYDGSNVTADAPTVSLTSTAVNGNSSASAAGGITVAARAALTATGGSVDANTALSAGGLYIPDGGTATLDGTSVSSNIADGGATTNAGDGGGVFNSGVLTLTNATVNGNQAKTTTTPSGTNIAGEGGAIYAASNQSAGAVRTTLTGDTFSGNSAVIGSVLETASTAGTNNTAVTNSTITGNTSSSAFGAIVPLNPVSIEYATITDNTAAAGGAGAIVEFGAGVARITGSIVSNNKSGAATTNCVASQPPTDGGYNLTDATDPSCGFTPGQHDVAAAPQLGPLAANGGPTQTRAPGASSPAINVIPPGSATAMNNVVTGNAITLCAAGDVDQRGVSRPQGTNCDIGAVEANLSSPTVAGPATPTFTTGVAGSFVYTTTGVPTPHLTETAALPSGVTFHDNGDGTATLAGTPGPNAGGTYAISVVASNGVSPDASESVVITVNQPPTVTGPSSATFVVNHAGTVPFGSTGFPRPGLTESGALPSGVTFQDNGDGTATLAGTPAPGTVGSYPIVITATNGTPPNGTLAFTLTVNPSIGVATSALPNGAIGVTYLAHLTATGGQPPYTWQITSGALPTGLSMADDGTISGVPTGPVGTATITFLAIDSLNPAGTDSKTLTLTIDRGPTALTVDPVLLAAGGLKLNSGAVSARLVGGSPSQPLAGQTIVFTGANSLVCYGLTGADGVASCNATPSVLLAIVAGGGVTATYNGSALWLPTTAKGALIG
jgi:putative Ig domain-containing protein